MIQGDGVFSVRVVCCSAHADEGAPCCFFLGKRRIEVAEIVDRWPAPDHRYFKVRGDDNALYILRYDVAGAHWQLTMFKRNGRW